MTLGLCKVSECTVTVTGACLQSYPPDKCPQREGIEENTSTGEQIRVPIDLDVDQGDKFGTRLSATSNPDSPVLERPEEMPRLPTSGTLGVEGANRLINERRAHAIGLVGLPDSGKTACLASIYLLLAKGQFHGFGYVNSSTLMAFEEIARGTRRWNGGNPPTQMTAHTDIAEDRAAGFLHLRLLRKADNQMLDLLIPDLPGEWSTALIERNETDRFDFLKSVSVIWIMVDGRKFIDPVAVNFATHQAKCLIERLADFLPQPRPRIILVTSWHDQGATPAAAMDKIKNEGTRCDIEIDVVSIASFSENEDVKAGAGLVALIEATLRNDPLHPEFWPEGETSISRRSLLTFRRQE